MSIKLNLDDTNIFFAKKLLYVCTLALIVRVLAIVFFVDIHSNYYWEYGEIAKNILAGKGYSYFYFINSERYFLFSAEHTPLPSAYMPPGYVTYLLPFIAINNIVVRNILLLASQTLFSLTTLVALYYFCREYFSIRIAIISVCFFALLPDFIYAVISFTPTVLFQCGVILLMILLYKKRQSRISIFFIAINCTVMILMRSEFFLFLVLLLIVFAWQKQLKKIVLIGLIVMSSLSPWIYRNYSTFDTFVPFTTSSGLNLFRGNNSEEIGTWGNITTKEQESNLSKNERYEIVRNNLFISNVMEYAKKHPLEIIKNIPVKLFDLWGYDRHSNRSNILYSIYSVIFSFLFFVGLTNSFSKHHIPLYLFFICFSLVVALFFSLPRYQTMLRVGMIPFASHGIVILQEILKKKSFYLMR
jgi:hypothetical protein